MPNFRMQIATEDGWGPEITVANGDPIGTFGKAITNFKIEGPGIKKARVRNRYGTWFPYKEGYEALGDDTSIVEMEIIGNGYEVTIHLLQNFWMNPVEISTYEGYKILGVATIIDGIKIRKI